MGRKWFQLVRADGNPLTSVDAVVAEFEDVDAVREAVKLKFADSYVARIAASDLTVFADRAAYASKQKLPKSSSSVTELGKDNDNALIVAVPSQRQVGPTVDLQQVEWTLEPEPCPQFLVNDGDPLIELPPRCLGGTGIGRPGQTLILYRRPPLVQQWNEMNRCSIRTYARLWIVGPPGAGNSCAALSFAWSLNRSRWDVIWIHYSEVDRNFNCVWLQGNTKAVGVVKEETITRDLELILNSTSQTRKTIAFLDGYVKSCTAGEAAFLRCLRWHQQDKMKHRLVCVCSMMTIGTDYRPELYPPIENVDEDEELSGMKNVDVATREYHNLEETTKWHHPTQAWVDSVYSQMLFEATSWLFEEYQDAVLNHDMFHNVVGMFPPYSTQADPVMEAEERIKLLQAKYFVAGANARLMFDFTTETAIEELDKAIVKTPNIENYLRGFVGEPSDGTVNRLLALYDSAPQNPYDIRLVSAYVLRSFAVQMGPHLLKEFTSACSVNPSTDGSVLEACFFAELTHKGLAWSVFVESELRRCNWERSAVVVFDPGKYPLLLPLNDPTWVAPLKWDPGSYDAALVDNAKQLVRFVQVMRAESYTFDEEYFIDLLRRLVAGDVNQVAAVELCFVVPTAKLETFKAPVSKEDFMKNIVETASSASQGARSHADQTAKACSVNVMVIGVDTY